jgi:hypothetical protein
MRRAEAGIIRTSVSIPSKRRPTGFSKNAKNRSVGSGGNRRLSAPRHTQISEPITRLSKVRAK